MTTQEPPPRPSHLGPISNTDDGAARPNNRSQIFAWSLYDWGNSAVGAIMTSFVFSVYLVSPAFGDSDRASSVLGFAVAVGGLLIALLAPVTGQRADASGRRKFFLGLYTAGVVILTAACFFVEPDPRYLILGAALLAGISVFNELAGVNYNAMLLQISTKQTIGKVSGFGWAMGYMGGIVGLAIVLFGFIDPNLLGIPTEDALNIRSVALFSAVWIGVFAIPVLLKVPELPKGPKTERVGFFASYGVLFRRVRQIYRERPHTIYFLLSSAVFRDGLAAIFTFGGVIAAGTFGFEPRDVILFAIAGNVLAALGALAAGPLDDRIGPKWVILIALAGLIVSGTAIFFAHEQIYFWIFGLALCLFVGPAQASARSFVGRLAPEGQAGELYGLFATTGRAVSFLAPLLFGIFVAWGGEQRWGILGIMVVLVAGLLLLLPVKAPAEQPEPREIRAA